MAVISLRTNHLTDELERLYRARFGFFVSVANAILHDEHAAKDAVQEAFAAAIRRQSVFRRGNLEAWVWKIVVNTAISARRRQLRVRSHEHLDSDVEAASDSSLETLSLSARFQSSDYRSSVGELIEALSERQRIAIFLRYYADMDYESIAGVLNVRLGTVAATLHAAHSSLRRGLEEAANE